MPKFRIYYVGDSYEIEADEAKVTEYGALVLSTYSGHVIAGFAPNFYQFFVEIKPKENRE